MLGKLLKYDMKHKGKLFIITAIVVLALASIARASSELLNFSFAYYIVMGLKITLVIAIMFAIVANVINAILHFRNSVLKDEGYLTNTLPVSPSSIYASKLISSYICCVGTVIIAIISAFIVFGNADGIKDIMSQIQAATGKSAVPFLILVGIYGLIEFFAALAQFHTALVFGYSAKGNVCSRDFMSVLAYIGTYVIVEIVSVISMLIAAMISLKDLSEIFDENAVVPVDFITTLFVVCSITIGACGIIMSIVSTSRLKRLNLE